MRDMIEEVVVAFDGHLEHTAAVAKQHFRWIKRRYRERVDVNRVAAATELKVGCSIARRVPAMADTLNAHVTSAASDHR